MGLGLVFCRYERCSHGLVGLKRSSELLSGRQQAEGASGQGDAFLFGKELAQVRSSGGVCDPCIFGAMGCSYALVFNVQPPNDSPSSIVESQIGLRCNIDPIVRLPVPETKV